MSFSSKHHRSSNSGAAADKAAEFHPTSKWQEMPREDELTLWEVHRKPRKLITKNRRIRCPLKMLNPQFRCVICLQYLKETTMVMVCLHRFCGECINKCVRIGMKECPSCRKSIPSRRSLRRDIKFDHIVNKMAGSLSERLHSEEQDASKTVHLQQAIFKKKHIVDRLKRGVDGKQGSSSPSSQRNKAPRLIDFQQSPLLEVELRRHPHEDRVDRLERGFLTIRGDAKVSLLKTFLSQKLEHLEYEISSNLDDDSVVLDDDLALIDAKETLCADTAKIIVLKYRISAAGSGIQEATGTEIDLPEAKPGAQGNKPPNMGKYNNEEALDYGFAAINDRSMARAQLGENERGSQSKAPKAALKQFDRNYSERKTSNPKEVYGKKSDSASYTFETLEEEVTSDLEV